MTKKESVFNKIGKKVDNFFKEKAKKSGCCCCGETEKGKGEKDEKCCK